MVIKIRENLYGIVLIILSIIFVSVPIYSEAHAFRAVPNLDDNIAEIEKLIGDYTEYYVMVSPMYNSVSHNIGSTTINKNKL